MYERREMGNTFGLLSLILKGYKLLPEIASMKPKIKITLTLAGKQMDPPGENARIIPFW